jgi:DNA-binding Xre family transcriptional regulator
LGGIFLPPSLIGGNEEYSLCGTGKAIIPQTEWRSLQLVWVAKALDKQFGTFLRKQRGESTYAAFSRKIGVSASTLYRLERAEQSVTLGKLEEILGRLKCTLDDVFKAGNG